MQPLFMTAQSALNLEDCDYSAQSNYHKKNKILNYTLIM